jgi:polyisoprenoid-binding protein YceI
VQARLLGPDVLDITRFPEISFLSTTIEPSGPMRWRVTGHLTIHGQMRTITFPVALESGRYRGEVTVKQRDFGIEPIAVAGGVVKVKDEIRIQFEIAG